MSESRNHRFFPLAVAALGISTCIAQPPTVGGCQVFPADNIWNTPVDQLPLSPLSSTYVNTIGAAKTAHPDFGGGLWNGAPIGIPFVTVTANQTKYPATFQYADESDPGPYAIPLNAPIEGGRQSTGDRHALAIDTGNCILYELYAAYPQATGWSAGSGAIFNLLSNALRPSGWTSTDAAGLPVFAGLFRYDEVAAGEIRHARRFTVPQTQRAFVWPARHYASSLTGSQYPPMGARFRLRAGFDISGYSAANQVILRALKKYGMMLADNGSAWYLSGAPDPRWDDTDLHNLGKITGADFELVDVSGLMISPDSGQARQSGAAAVPVLTSVSPSSGAQGTAVPVTLSGANFAAGATLALSGTGVAASNVVVAGPGAITATFTIAATAATGARNVTVTTAGGASAAQPFTVTAPIMAAPTLTSVNPSSAARGAIVGVTLTGTNFTSPATVFVQSGVTVSNVVVVNSTTIAAVFHVAPNAARRGRNVTVQTSAGVSNARTFTIR